MESLLNDVFLDSEAPHLGQHFQNASFPVVISLRLKSLILNNESLGTLLALL